MAHEQVPLTQASLKAFKAGAQHARETAIAEARKLMLMTAEDFSVPSHKECTRLNCSDCVRNNLYEELKRTAERAPFLMTKSNYIDDLEQATEQAMRWIRERRSTYLGRETWGVRRPPTATAMVLALIMAADDYAGFETVEETGIRYSDGHVVEFDSVDPDDVLPGDTVVVRKRTQKVTEWEDVKDER